MRASMGANAGIRGDLLSVVNDGEREYTRTIMPSWGESWFSITFRTDDRLLLLAAVATSSCFSVMFAHPVEFLIP